MPRFSVLKNCGIRYLNVNEKLLKSCVWWYDMIWYAQAINHENSSEYIYTHDKHKEKKKR